MSLAEKGAALITFADNSGLCLALVYVPASDRGPSGFWTAEYADCHVQENMGSTLERKIGHGGSIEAAIGDLFERLRRCRNIVRRPPIGHETGPIGIPLEWNSGTGDPNGA